MTFMSNAFTLFDLSPSFGVDTELLEERYLAAAAESHPDQFADPLEQAEAAERAAAINQAYHTLKSPLLRAEALLKIAGVDDKQQDIMLPADFLMEMMEQREALEQAIGKSNQATLQSLASDAGKAMQEQLDEFGRLIESVIQQSDHEKLPAARLALAKARYFKRMTEAAQA